MKLDGKELSKETLAKAMELPVTAVTNGYDLDAYEEELSVSLLTPLSRLTEAERETIMKTRSQKEIADVLKAAGVTLL